MSYSILVEPIRKRFYNSPQKVGAFHPAAPKIVSWFGCTVRGVRRVGQQQIAGPIDRFEEVAQNKFDITLTIEHCIELGKRNSALIDVCADDAFTMVCRQNSVDTRSCPQVDRAPAWSSFNKAPQNEALTPQPHNLIDCSIFRSMIGYNVFAVARKQTSVRP